MLFDTHAHYDDEAFDPDRELLLESLPQRGVALVVNPGCDLESSRKAVAYAAEYPHLYAAVGIHPENCGGFTPADMDALVLGALPALDQQQPVLVLGGEVVVVGQAARLLPDEGQDALFHDLTDERLAAAGLGLIFHI